MAKLNTCDRDSTQNLKYLLSGSKFTEQVC